jgi:Flp pilus assembly protein TadD
MPSDVEAKAIEQQIGEIWRASDDAVISALMRAGIVAVAQEDNAVALKRFERLVKQTPDVAEGWNKRAAVQHLIGNFPASVSEIEHTLELERCHVGALSGLGAVCYASEEPAAELRGFEAPLVIDPHLAETRYRVKELRREPAGRRT